MVGFSPEAKSSSNRYLAVAFIMLSIDQFVFAAALRDHDFALGRQVLGDVDQQCLRLVDIAKPYRAHRLQVFDEQLGGAAGHIGKKQLPPCSLPALHRTPPLPLLSIA